MIKRALLALSFVVGGCSVYDFGGRKPVEVVLDAKTASWNTGIGLLFAVKCASCHAPGNPLRPANVPTFLFQNEAVVQANKALIIGEVFTEKTMPPSFGTPLTDNERAGLKGYFER